MRRPGTEHREPPGAIDRAIYDLSVKDEQTVGTSHRPGDKRSAVKLVDVVLIRQQFVGSRAGLRPPLGNLGSLEIPLRELINPSEYLGSASPNKSTNGNP